MTDFKVQGEYNLEIRVSSKWPKWPFSGMSPMVAKGRQGSPRFKGDPRDGWDELKPDQSYFSHLQAYENDV